MTHYETLARRRTPIRPTMRPSEYGPPSPKAIDLASCNPNAIAHPPPDGDPIQPDVIAERLAIVRRLLTGGQWGLAVAVLRTARKPLAITPSDVVDGPALVDAAAELLCGIASVHLRAGSLQAACHAVAARRNDTDLMELRVEPDDHVCMLGLSTRTVNALEGRHIRTVRRLAAKCEEWCAKPWTTPPNFGGGALFECVSAMQQTGFIRAVAAAWLSRYGKDAEKSSVSDTSSIKSRYSDAKRKLS